MSNSVTTTAGRQSPRLSISTSVSPETSWRRRTCQNFCLSLCDWVASEVCCPPFDKNFERRLVRQANLVTVFGIAALLVNLYPGVLMLFVRHQSPHVYPANTDSFPSDETPSGRFTHTTTDASQNDDFQWSGTSLLELSSPDPLNVSSPVGVELRTSSVTSVRSKVPMKILSLPSRGSSSSPQHHTSSFFDEHRWLSSPSNEHLASDAWNLRSSAQARQNSPGKKRLYSSSGTVVTQQTSGLQPTVESVIAGNSSFRPGVDFLPPTLRSTASVSDSHYREDPVRHPTAGGSLPDARVGESLPSFLSEASSSSPHIIVPRLTEDLHSFTKGLFWVLTFVGVSALIPLQLSLLLCTVPLTEIRIPRRRNDCICSIISVNNRLIVYNCLCAPALAVFSAINFDSYYTADSPHLRVATHLLAYTAVALAASIHLPLALHVYNFTRFFEGAAAYYQLHESLSSAPPGTFGCAMTPRKVGRKGDTDAVQSRERIIERLVSKSEGHSSLAEEAERPDTDEETSPLLA
ncbi:putative transmembrane protein [Toxoplasma gondii RUB]|uniref:Putative transmembrane protein n=1 Tax=Toxoplasma gondii RUB TaxID=935652 RepID=A0A086LTY8_TOXGO|nr:putative transmembrane protein [Toxoplasma gondii RUB]